MKIAYIVLAHKYPEQLKRLIIKLDNEETSFFIHIDKKTSNKVYNQIVSSLSHLPNVYFLNRYKCYWGGFGLVKATIQGIKEIFDRNISFDWLILLSGQDYPLKTNSQIKKALEKNEGKLFLTHYDYLIPPDKKWPTSGSDRIDYWHFCLSNYVRFVFPAKLTANSYLRYKILKRPWLQFISFLYSCLFFWLPLKKRKFPEGFKPFIGSQFWCLSRDCVEYIHVFVQQNPDFINFFMYVDIPDEMFFQTVVLNSPFKERVVNDNLFCIDWDNINQTYPKVFVKTDFDRLISSSKLFARKFDMIRDVDILNLLDQKLLSDAVSRGNVK